MIYRGITISCPEINSSTYLHRLISETPWSDLREIFPEVYKEASQLVSLYYMAKEVLRCGVVQYYQTLFADDSPDPNPDRLLPCEEWQCIAFDQLCRFSRSNYAQAVEHKYLSIAYKAFRAMEGDPAKGHVKGSDTFERALMHSEHYFFQVCEQKAEYLCKYMGKELSKRISSTKKMKAISIRKTSPFKNKVPNAGPDSVSVSASITVTCKANKSRSS